MKTIHPLKLEAMLEASQPVEIVDIRPRAEFEKIHIEGAHSIPSARFQPRNLFAHAHCCRPNRFISFRRAAPSPSSRPAIWNGKVWIM